jgi:hypothetical protein
MAKAKRKSTPSKNARPASAEAERKIGWFQPSAEEGAEAGRRLREAGWLPAAEYSVDQAKFGKAIDRAIAIRDNLIPPPWMDKSKGKGQKRSRVEQILPEAFPNGPLPVGTPEKTICEPVDAAFDKRGWKRVSRQTVMRAYYRWKKPT